MHVFVRVHRTGCRTS